MNPIVTAGLIAGGIYIALLTYYIRRLIKQPDSH